MNDRTVGHADIRACPAFHTVAHTVNVALRKIVTFCKVRDAAGHEIHRADSHAGPTLDAGEDLPGFGLIKNQDSARPFDDRYVQGILSYPHHGAAHNDLR